MLKPFDQKTATHKGPSRKDKQHNLWSVRSAPKPKGPAESLDRRNLREIAVQWPPEAMKTDLPQVTALRERCAAQAETLSNRHDHAFAEMRMRGQKCSGDAAACLVLNELDKKGAREAPDYRLKMLDFGIGALGEEKN